MTSALTYVLIGASLLVAVVTPPLLGRAPVTTPMILVGIGMLVGLTDLPDGLPINPISDRAIVEHATELTVIVALMGVGLALDRALDLRSWASIRAWSATWRLLAVAMPLTIAGVALLGWWAGLPLAAAVLLGAVLAPTDPVLASDVQVGGPSTVDPTVDPATDLGPEEGPAEDECDEVRFALTSEAGLNDGLAFPFVYLAVLLAGTGTAWSVAGEFVGWYLVAKVGIGVAVGAGIGWLLARLAFRSSSPALRVADLGEPLLAIAALTLSYGAAELVQGYGFLAVFACAMSFRMAERRHAYHRAMHEVVDRLERLLTLFVLLALGVALTRGLLENLDWRGVGIGLALIFVVRPLAGCLALGVLPVPGGRSGAMTRPELMATAFFGVRGVGSLYYLAYAAGEVEAFADGWLWSTVGFTVIASVLVHGALAGPAMSRLDSRSRS